LESSDVDGGSSVAVLTYLRHILVSLDQPELIHMILQYLLAMPDTAKEITPHSPLSLKRRTSLMLLAQTENEDERLHPSLFSLVDLLFSSVRSKNPQTVVAAYKLITVILSKNHAYAVGTLLQITSPQSKEPPRTHGALNAEIEAYFALAEDIGGDAGVEEAYDTHLKDALKSLETHQCSAQILALNAPMLRPASDLEFSEPPKTHSLRMDDSLFGHVMTMLHTFLTNNVEANLGLTETLVTLASCPRLRLEGWLALEPAYYEFFEAMPDHQFGSTDPVLQALRAARRQPTWSSSHTPQLLRVLETLRNEVGLLRAHVPDFDQLVASRKQAFQVHDQISSALQNRPSPPPASATVQSTAGAEAGWKPQRPAAMPRRVLAETSVNASRGQSPQGGGPTLNPVPVKLSPSQGPTGRNASPTSTSRERSRVHASARETRRTSGILQDVVKEAGDAEGLKRMITIPVRGAEESDNADTGAESREASLSHVLTNVVVLQEFVLEMVAVMQVRASLFGEVTFV